MLKILQKNWWVFGLRGLLSIIFGVLALVWPEITLLTLVTLFGVFVLVDGVLDLLAGFASAESNRRWWVLILEGLVEIGVALMTFFWTDITAIVLLYFIAAWAVLSGLMEIIAAVQLRRMIENEWAMILGGILSIVLGVLLIIFPQAGAVSLTWLIGIFAIIFGILFVILAFQLRKNWRETKRTA